MNEIKRHCKQLWHFREKGFSNRVGAGRCGGGGGGAIKVNLLSLLQ